MTRVNNLDSRLNTFQTVLDLSRGGEVLNASEINQKTNMHRRGGGERGSIISTSKERKQSSSSSYFPIYKSELSHFLSMSLMMFLFIYVFTTTRDTKDTLIVSNCGAESIPFLKLYGVMPSAFLFIMGYTRMSQLVGKKVLFYMTLVPFFIFYTLFAFVLFPNRELIHNYLVKDIVIKSNAVKAAYSLVKYWSYSLYFIVSELWASAGVPLLFWQVSNIITIIFIGSCISQDVIT